MDLLNSIVFASIVFLLWVPTSGQADLNFASPGPLASPHAKLEGSDNCTLCHEAGKQVVAEKCLDCHKDLKKQIDRKRGYHAQMGPEQNECAKCHPDHAGRDLEMVKWDNGREHFDHTLTGYPLAGKHAGLKCDECHQARLIRDPAVRAIKNTYLGLSAVCADCHPDVHKGDVGKRCEACHNETTWKPVTLFDHRKTRFPLTGRHETTACGKCHPQVTEGGTTRMKFAPIPHDGCKTCHEDVHKGKFGAACENCHSTDNWMRISEKGMPKKGFHDKTRYPLVGAHASVPCVACHGPFPGEKARFRGMKFEACTDCHIDAHLGQLSRNASGQTCDRCHTLEGFLPARYTVEDHARTRYPLEGAHKKAECRSCHPQEPSLEKKIPASVSKFLRTHGRKDRFSLALLRFSQAVPACETCHEDIHAGQFAGSRGTRSDCKTCHTVEAFKGNLLFDHNDPRFSKYPLEGKHQSVKCEKCHLPVLVAKNVSIVKYVGLPKTCDGCHADEHNGMFRGFES